MTRTISFLFSLFFAVALCAQSAPTITPNSGTTNGGEVVIIKGDFGTWPPTVRFGDVEAPSAERLDATTIRVVTPPHLPGTVPIFLFDYDMWIGTGLTFTFVGDVPESAYERVLLPIFSEPVAGANGSEFRTAFDIMNASESAMTVFGLVRSCQVLCPVVDYTLDPAQQDTADPNGRPGRFVYVQEHKADALIAQLRAFDVSRSATNFGTEIPVVREDELRFEPVTLLGVPTDPRFRNTLRIYSEDERAFMIRMEGANGFVLEESVNAAAGTDIFDPAYAQFASFPTNVGPLRVTIRRLEPITSPPAPPVRFWAFISVTNNDTQHITVISPQR